VRMKMQKSTLVAIGLSLIVAAGWYWAYQGRANLETATRHARTELVHAQRRACADDITDRASDILVRAAQAWATQQVASDPRQPHRTRVARAIEARQDRASVRDRLTRVDDSAATVIYRQAPNHAIRALILYLDSGQRLHCTARHPTPPLP
jgi:hypothetical protein